MNPYRDDFIKKAGAIKGLFQAGVSALTPTTGLGRLMRRGATASLFTGAFNTAADEQMQDRYGIMGTFGRKMIDPRTYVMGAGISLGMPLLNKATLGAGKSLAALDRVGGNVPLLNMATRPLGAVGRLTEMFTSRGARYAANQAGGTGRYIRRGFREGGADKDMFFNTLKEMRGTKSFQNQYGGAWGKVKQLFSDPDAAYTTAANRLTELNRRKFMVANKPYLKELGRNPSQVVDPGKLVGGTVTHSFGDNMTALQTAMQNMPQAQRLQFLKENQPYLKEISRTRGEIDPNRLVGGAIQGPTNVIGGNLRVTRGANGEVSILRPGARTTQTPFGEFNMKIDAYGRPETHTGLGGKSTPIIEAVKRKGGAMGFKGFAPVMNPYSAMGAPAIGGMLMGYEHGPWSPQTALFNEDAPVYKPFGTPRGRAASQFKTY